jgi:hypothetical protein
MIADQPLWSGVLFESAKIQIVFTATVQNDTHTQEMVRQNLRAHLDLFAFLHTGKEERSPCVRTHPPLSNYYILLSRLGPRYSFTVHAVRTRRYYARI